MQAIEKRRNWRGWCHSVAVAIRVIILLLPAALLLLGVLRTTGSCQTMLALGALFQILVCILAFLSSRSWRQPLGPSVITLHLIALGWLWMGLGLEANDDWYPHLSQAELLIVPLLAFAVHTLTSSGAATRRRARVLAQRLSNRKDWPTDLAACRTLPEVKALREALHLDATPALNLLSHLRTEVRVAALGALEFRKEWRPGEAELVLQLAKTSREPAIRVAALFALANIDDPLMVEELAAFLQDPHPSVRRAATEAVLWDTEARWRWIRHAVRFALANPHFQDDGPLQLQGRPLCAEAVADLSAWVSEKGILAIRAAETLGVHYLRVLSENWDDDLVALLKIDLADVHAPAALRIELAQLMKRCHRLDVPLLERLVDPVNPAPLRLIAAEALLQSGQSASALAALQDIGRYPNREMALATAEVVQRCLGIDLGLPRGQAFPALHSRLAADVTRRVMLWATQPMGRAPASCVVL